MQPSLPELLHEWHDFYMLAGTASAALVGLMFVAASIGAQVFSPENRDALGTFITPTVMHFSAVVYICLVALVPTHGFAALALFLLLGGAAGSLHSGRVWLRVFVRRRFHVDFVDRFFYALIPVVAHLLVLASAGLLFAHSTMAFPLLAVSVLILLAAGIRNAWDMTIWVVLQSPTTAPITRQREGESSGS